jgi:hypothetical protein
MLENQSALVGRRCENAVGLLEERVSPRGRRRCSGNTEWVSQITRRRRCSVVSAPGHAPGWGQLAAELSPPGLQRRRPPPGACTRGANGLTARRTADAPAVGHRADGRVDPTNRRGRLYFWAPAADVAIVRDRIPAGSI